MSIECAVLMCHAPIVVPPIGAQRADACLATTAAMREAAALVVASEPDTVVLISPHTPRERDRWGVLGLDTWIGSFAGFGVSGVEVRAQAAPKQVSGVLRAAKRECVPASGRRATEMDHGVLVPLWFLAEAGLQSPLLVIALPFAPRLDAAGMGRAVRGAAERAGERWAVVASGDLSHRLTPGAPAGYEPEAADFDRAFAERLARGDLRGAVRPDPRLRALAAEDVIETTRVAAAAVGSEGDGVRLLHYEGPFGVGYAEAVLHWAQAAAGGGREGPPRELADIARGAIFAHLSGRDYAAPELSSAWRAARAVFVTLRTPDGRLRGCIGRIEPQAATLAREVAECAVSAASQDPRMAPLEAGELDQLRIEVSVLSPKEPVRSVEQLDPARFGVVVSSGARRGVLLPNVEGVDTVERQLAIARRKAAIGDHEPHLLERFAVDKVGSSSVRLGG